MRPLPEAAGVRLKDGRAVVLNNREVPAGSPYALDYAEVRLAAPERCIPQRPPDGVAFSVAGNRKAEDRVEIRGGQCIAPGDLVGSVGISDQEDAAFLRVLVSWCCALGGGLGRSPGPRRMGLVRGYWGVSGSRPYPTDDGRPRVRLGPCSASNGGGRGQRMGAAPTFASSFPPPPAPLAPLPFL